MLSWLRKVDESHKLLIVGVYPIIPLSIANFWPHLVSVSWISYLIIVAIFFYDALQEPVNYESMDISAGTIKYVSSSVIDPTIIHLEDVLKLEFVREEALFPDDYGSHIESKWLIYTHSHNSSIEIMDEWPHRKQLLQAFQKHLPDFDDAAARAGLNAWSEGRWLCYLSKPHVQH